MTMATFLNWIQPTMFHVLKNILLWLSDNTQFI